MLTPRRAGLLLVGLILLVIILEVGLSVFRVRNVTAELVATGATPIPTATPQITVTPADPDATSTPEVSTVVTVSTKGAPVVNVRVDYRIGPRFPTTNFYAEALNSSGNIVAGTAQTFECGADALRCEGTLTLTLNYGQIDPQVVARRTTPTIIPTVVQQDWQIGQYTMRLTRSFGGLDPQQVTQQPFIIVD